MKKTNYLADLQKQDTAKLEKALADAKKKLFNLRFQNATHQLTNTAEINEVRKNIARIQTVLAQKSTKA